MSLRLAQRHCALALVAALDDDRRECYRLIVEAARAAGLSLKYGGPRRVVGWSDLECRSFLRGAMKRLAEIEVFPQMQDHLATQITDSLSTAAELAWPGPDEVPVLVAPKENG